MCVESLAHLLALQADSDEAMEGEMQGQDTLTVLLLVATHGWFSILQSQQVIYQLGNCDMCMLYFLAA